MMKKARILILFVLIFSLTACTQQVRLESVWQTKLVLKAPESVCFDAKSDHIHVSNINGKPAAKDGNGFISLLNEKGKIVQLKWATGLNAPKGMAIKGNHLFVSDIDRLAEIDLSNGKLSGIFLFPGLNF